MPHEVDGQVHWHEPSGLSPAGLRRWLRPKLAHDRFMDDEGLPIIRAAGITDLLRVDVADWRRLGAGGAFLQLFGTECGLGCTLLELAASGTCRPEKHLHEEIVLVLQGRGTTELWQPNATERVMFEWQPGSLFAIPANALHRMVNATAAPARLLCLSNAPALLNLLGDVDAVFANPFVWSSRFDEEAGIAFDDIEPDPITGLALCRTGLIPDALLCDLPLDNRLSPGYRQMGLAMTGPGLACHLGEHRPGRYAKAMIPTANSLSVCLRGSGFSYVWPETLGPTPWRDGKGAEVMRFDHTPHALTGPGPGRWYHQLFNTGTTPLRHLVVQLPQPPSGPPGEEMQDDTTMIAYADEDAHIRAAYAKALVGTGAINRMRDADYLPDES